MIISFYPFYPSFFERKPSTMKNGQRFYRQVCTFVLHLLESDASVVINHNVTVLWWVLTTSRLLNFLGEEKLLNGPINKRHFFYRISRGYKRYDCFCCIVHNLVTLQFEYTFFNISKNFKDWVISFLENKIRFYNIVFLNVSLLKKS